jgi:hypothetical protein
VPYSGRNFGVERLLGAANGDEPKKRIQSVTLVLEVRSKFGRFTEEARRRKTSPPLPEPTPQGWATENRQKGLATRPEDNVKIFETKISLVNGKPEWERDYGQFSGRLVVSLRQHVCLTRTIDTKSLRVMETGSESTGTANAERTAAAD